MGDGIGFGSVVPIKVAEWLKEYSPRHFGTYQLLLAHDVVQHPNQYKAVYGDMSTIIMDNSVIELGEPVGPGTMASALEIVANKDTELVCVLPDKLLDKDGTLEAIHEAFTSGWAAQISDLLDPLKVRFMAVPQGSNIGEWVQCAEEINGKYHPAWIGIPRNYREKLGGSRIQAAQFINMLNPSTNIHMLGFSDDLHDDMVSCNMSRKLGYKIRGIDSAVPVRLAMREQKLLRLSESTHSSRGDWWDNPGVLDEDTLIGVRHNLHNVRLWLNGN